MLPNAQTIMVLVGHMKEEDQVIYREFTVEYSEDAVQAQVYKWVLESKDSY